MKNTFLTTFIFLLLSTSVSAQKMKKLIDKNDGVKLEKYLSKGGDVNEALSIGNFDNVHPLIYATGTSSKSCFDVLLNYIEDFTDKDDVLSEAFILSLSQEDDYFSSELYKLNPDLKGTCSVCHGNNAIMTAAVHGKEAWYFKLKEQSDLLMVNTAGATLLHAGATGSSETILNDILKIDGINDYLDHGDNRGLTPLDYAVGNENETFFQIILDAGVDPEKAWNLTYQSMIYFNKAYFESTLFEEKLDGDLWKADEDNYIPLAVAVWWDQEYIEECLDDGNTVQINMCNYLLRRMTSDLRENGCANYKSEYFEGIPIVSNLWYFVSWFNEDFSEESDDLMITLLEFSKAVEECGQDPVIGKDEYKEGGKVLGKDYMEMWYMEMEHDIPTE